MRWSSTCLFMSFLVAGGSIQCPLDESMKKQLEELLVDDDNIFNHGMQSAKFSQVWVRKGLHERCDCLSSELSKKQDGTMDVVIFCTAGRVEIKTWTPETRTPGGKKGLYSINGVNDITMQKYTGMTYMIYADKHVNAYYKCINEDSRWGMSVVVIWDEKQMLGSKEEDNEVKQSVEKARLKMVQAAEILNLNLEKDVAMYDVDKLC